MSLGTSGLPASAVLASDDILQAKSTGWLAQAFCSFLWLCFNPTAGNTRLDA